MWREDVERGMHPTATYKSSIHKNTSTKFTEIVKSRLFYKNLRFPAALQKHSKLKVPEVRRIAAQVNHRPAVQVDQRSAKQQHKQIKGQKPNSTEHKVTKAQQDSRAR